MYALSVLTRGTAARERPERPMRTASELIGTAASLRRESIATAPSSTASQYSMTPSAKVLASQTKIFSAGKTETIPLLADTAENYCLSAGSFHVYQSSAEMSISGAVLHSCI